MQGVEPVTINYKLVLTGIPIDCYKVTIMQFILEKMHKMPEKSL